MSNDYQDEPQGSGKLIWLLAACVAVFIAWAAYFEIDQTIHTTGQVILSARTQLVQAADGGVLKELKVKEGDTVKSGQLLAVLEKERVQANLDETRSKIMSLKAALFVQKQRWLCLHLSSVLSSKITLNLFRLRWVCSHRESFRWTKNYVHFKML